MHRHLFFILYISFLWLLLGCDAKTNTKEKDQLLLISFDGFRYDYLEKAPTPHFDSLVSEGVEAEGLIPVFPTKTFPNHYSIATGLYPEHTGLVANNMYDPEFEEWYRISKRDAVEDKKWYSGEPIWNTAEKQGLKTGTMFWVGSEAPIQSMRPTYWKPFDGSMPNKARIDTVVKWLSYPDDRAADFATLYFELVDDAGHDYGLESDSLNFAIQQADSLLGYLKQQLKRARRWADLNMVILSDHGMVDLYAEKTIRLDSVINMEDVERINWAPVTMIEPKNGKKEEIYKALMANEEHYRVYKKEDLPAHYHIKNHRRVPEIILIADLGYTILSNDFKDRFLQRLPSATHGYDNGDKAMQAFFVARGPAFKKRYKMQAFQNIHIYELMCHLLNIEPSVNDGSLDSVRVMLR